MTARDAFVEFYRDYWARRGGAAPEADPTTPQRERLLLGALAASPGARDVLDAGCGDGHFLERLRSAGYAVTGLDVADEPLRLARARLGAAVPLVRHRLDAVPWPFGAGAFDAIWSSEVIEHLFGVREYLAEARRVLRDGGHLIVTTPYHGLVKNLVIAAWCFDRHFNNIDGGHIRFFTRRALSRLATEAGLVEVAFRTIGRVPGLARTMFVVYRKVGRSA